MYPLIEIKTVPIEIEMKTTNATWEYRRGTAEMEIRREKGGLKINSRPIRVQMDTFEARNSVSPTPMRSVEQSAQRGRQAAYEATAAYARHGKLLLNAKVGEDVVTQIATEPQQEAMNVTVNLDFLPMFIRSGLKKHIISLTSFISCDRIRKYDLICVSNMRFA